MTNKLNPNDYVQKYGGKAGGYFYLKDLGGFKKYLLPAIYLAPEQDVKEIKKDCESLLSHSKKIITRGTHPGDHNGLVDVLRTIPNNKEFEDISHSVNSMRSNAKSDEVTSYAKYDGVKDYDGNIGVLIQAMNDSSRRGSMVEHPHEKGTYIVEIVEYNRCIDQNRIRSFVLREDKGWNGEEFGDIETGLSVFDTPPTCEEELIKIIRLYESVRKSNFIESETSFQMEFGLSELDDMFDDQIKAYFYQARPFKKFEEPTFEFKGTGREEGIKYQCFGMTPEKGIVLPAIRGQVELDELEILCLNEFKEPFAWLDFVTQNSHPLSIKPTNLKTYIPVHPSFSMLEHSVYRWAKKADISIFAPRLGVHFSEFSDCDDKVRIISNGLFHGVEKIR